MQIPAGAECFVWEFLSSSMSILVDPLDVAFAIGIYYVNLDGGNWSLKIISHQIQIN
jgi:hypothetical protein